MFQSLNHIKKLYLIIFILIPALMFLIEEKIFYSLFWFSTGGIILFLESKKGKIIKKILF